MNECIKNASKFKLTFWLNSVAFCGSNFIIEQQHNCTMDRQNWKKIQNYVTTICDRAWWNFIILLNGHFFARDLSDDLCVTLDSVVELFWIDWLTLCWMICEKCRPIIDFARGSWTLDGFLIEVCCLFRFWSF